MRLLPDFTSSLFNVDSYVKRDGNGVYVLKLRAWIVIAVVVIALAMPLAV